ncbi:MAG: ATP-grasp domain-containing protein [Schlesneria sp.]
MRVFVSEFLVGGASSRSAVSASMRYEGLAMLHAVTEDIARLPGCSVVTTLESGVPFSSNIEVFRIDNPLEEFDLFQRLLGEVDAVLVIAPETDGVLGERCRQVTAANVTSWNCSVSAIELCGDKLLLANHLAHHGIPTLSTKLVDLDQPPDKQSFPVVLKPRDVAGSCLTFLIENCQHWEHASQSYRDAGASSECLFQPYLNGRPLSVGVNISLDGQRIECLPVGEQRLSTDGRFQYLGGAIPANISTKAQAAIHDLVLATCRSVEGLAGYVGFDLLLTNEEAPVIVEINPRLTTSYIGYRQLYAEAIPMRWLTSADKTPLTPCRADPVEFISTPADVATKWERHASS